MRIPNQFLTDFKAPCELKLACVLYSLIGKSSRTNLYGYELRIKQETLCDLCAFSLPTLKKAIDALSAKGFITSMQRSTYSTRKGTYIYTIKEYNLDRDYFLSDRIFFRKLNGQLLRVYLHFCRFAAGAERTFYHSYNDLADRLEIERRDIIRLVDKLVEKGLIYKAVKKTRAGDCTDNTYIVFRYWKGRIKKRYKAKRLTTFGDVISPKNKFHINVYIAYILSKINRFVKRFGGEKHKIFSLKRGSG